MFTIYRVTNIVTGQCYVGYTTQSIEQRWREHRQSAQTGSPARLHDAMQRSGLGAFEIESLETGRNDRIGLRLREPWWIQELQPIYNMTRGG